VQTVSLGVAQVVEAVDGARDEAEGKEYDDRRPQIVPLQQVVAEEYRCKHESVLDPLQRSEQLDIRFHTQDYRYLFAKVRLFCVFSKNRSKFLGLLV
jgi:hypothetical protein